MSAILEIELMVVNTIETVPAWISTGSFFSIISVSSVRLFSIHLDLGIIDSNSDFSMITSFTTDTCISA